MCGRYSLVTSEEKLKTQFPQLEIKTIPRPNYNIAPTQRASIITDEAPDRLQEFIWGLIPHWSKNGQNGGRLINARAEGISSKPSFRLPIRKKRCLVIADSFYEWQRVGKQKKPHRILLRDGNLLVFAGIWDIWMHHNKPIKSFSIITTTPNADMALLHSRMPVILNTQAAQERWLDKLSLPETLGMLQPTKDGILTDYLVSAKVNSVQNNGAELHYRVQEPPTLF